MDSHKPIFRAKASTGSTYDINHIVYDSFGEGDIHEIIPDLGFEGVFDWTYVLEPGYPAHHVSYVLEKS